MYQNIFGFWWWYFCLNSSCFCVLGFWWYVEMLGPTVGGVAMECNTWCPTLALAHNLTNLPTHSHKVISFLLSYMSVKVRVFVSMNYFSSVAEH